jgi:hypothetical protein
VRPRVRTEIEVRSASSSWPIHVETDAGEFFIKVANNREGPRVLVHEWIGYSVARILGVETPDCEVVDLPETLRIRLPNGVLAAAGPAFGSKREKAQNWGGRSSVPSVSNPEAFSRLVVLDTLLLNVDRYSVREDGTVRKNADNLLLCEAGAVPGKFILKAIDHGHAFLGPAWKVPDLRKIDNVRDSRVFGLFPEFQTELEQKEVSETLRRAVAVTDFDECFQEVPKEWSLSAQEKAAIAEFLKLRATFLLRELPASLWPQQSLAKTEAE